MGYLDDDVKKGDKDMKGAVEQKRLPPGPPTPPPQSTPPPQLLPPAKIAKQLPIEPIEMRGSQQTAKRGGIFLVFMDNPYFKVSDCGDGATKEGRVAFWDEKDGIEY